MARETAGALPPSLVRVLAPLDDLRRATLAVTLRVRWLRALFLDRHARVASVIVVHALLAWTVAVFVPVLLLVAGPVLVGVPHLAADVRHLLVRRPWPSRFMRVASALVLGLAVLPAFGLHDTTLTRLSVAGVIALGLAGISMGGRGSVAFNASPTGRSMLARASLVAALALLGAVAWLRPEGLRLVVVHLHNLVPWVLLAWWWGRQRSAFWGVAALVGCAALLLVRGTFAQLTLHNSFASLMPSHVLVWADGLAPGLRVEHAVGLTAAFAFLQSSHYVLWLIGIPELDRARSAPTKLITRTRLYFADLGRLGVTLVAVLVVALVAWALIAGWSHATDTYLRWAGFHAWAEMGLLALWVGGGLAFPHAQRVRRPA